MLNKTTVPHPQGTPPVSVRPDRCGLTATAHRTFEYSNIAATAPLQVSYGPLELKGAVAANGTLLFLSQTQRWIDGLGVICRQLRRPF